MKTEATDARACDSVVFPGVLQNAKTPKVHSAECTLQNVRLTHDVGPPTCLPFGRHTPRAISRIVPHELQLARLPCSPGTGAVWWRPAGRGWALPAPARARRRVRPAPACGPAARRAPLWWMLSAPQAKGKPRRPPPRPSRPRRRPPPPSRPWLSAPARVLARRRWRLAPWRQLPPPHCKRAARRRWCSARAARATWCTCTTAREQREPATGLIGSMGRGARYHAPTIVTHSPLSLSSSRPPPTVIATLAHSPLASLQAGAASAWRS